MIVFPVLALAQEQAREITREMGADTTTSVSQGLDRTGLHRDTETVRRGQQHAPSLLEASQGETSTTTKPSASERKRLLRKRELLLNDRKATIEAAGKKAEARANKPSQLSVTTQQVAEDKTAARRKAANDWDSKLGKEVQSIDRVLKQRAEAGTDVRFHAPALLNPR